MLVKGKRIVPDDLLNIIVGLWVVNVISEQQWPEIRKVRPGNWMEWCKLKEGEKERSD